MTITDGMGYIAASLVLATFCAPGVDASYDTRWQRAAGCRGPTARLAGRHYHRSAASRSSRSRPAVAGRRLAKSWAAIREVWGLASVG